MYIPDLPPVSVTKGKNGIERQYRCPLCGHKNLWWNANIGFGRCFTCQAEDEKKGRYNEDSLRRLMGDNELVDWAALDRLRAETMPLKKPPPRTRVELDNEDCWELQYYLYEERRCDQRDLEKCEVWYEPETSKVCIRVHPCNGRGDEEDPGTVVPYMCRSTDPETKGWRVQPLSAEKEKHWFNPLGIHKTAKTIVLVEGIFDVLTPRLMRNAIAMLGTSLTEHMEKALRDVPRIVIWTDPEDKAGRRASQTIVRQLLPRAVEVIYTKEPGECDPVEAREVIREALSRGLYG